MERSKYGDIFEERQQKIHQELNQFAIKYLRTVAKFIRSARLEKRVEENQPRVLTGRI